MTPRTTEREIIDGPAGALEVVVNAPTAPVAGIALIAHPLPTEGGTLDNKVVYTLAKTFFSLGYAAIRFNFRGVGASVGTFDEGSGETDDALAALGYAKRRFGNAEPVVLAGFSFAGIASHIVDELLPHLLRIPLHELLQFALQEMGVFAGRTFERLAHVPLADVLGWARPQELPIMVFPGCGHFFHGRLPQLQRVVAGQWQRRDVAMNG